MGNFQSMSPKEILQNLYNMNQTYLDKLHDGLVKKGFANRELLTNVREYQLKLKGKVEPTHYNKVSGFLNDLTINIQNFAKTKEEIYIEQREARMKKFRESLVQPLKMFKLENDFTEEELKTNYKLLARKYHPDRAEGNKEKFMIIQKAYERLLEDLKMRAPEKDFNSLKNESRDFIENTMPSMNLEGAQGKFDRTKFNQIYEENRTNKAEDDGYGDWIKNNEVADGDVPRDPRLAGGFNLTNFNSAFDTGVKNPIKKIVKYTMPQAQFSDAGVDSTELGVDKIDNFGGKGYSDYREAHTTSRLIPDEAEVNRKEYKSVQNLEADRSNMVPLSMEEIRSLKAEERLKETAELRRQENVSIFDRREFDVYSKINRRMIEHDFFR